MHVMVLGAGITGVTTAWFLAKAGFQVSVIERQPEAALETSHANGGQISISHPEPWANPSAPMTALRWLGREDAPLLFRPHADRAQWAWALAFLRECLPGRTQRNTEAIARLAVYSAAQLRALRTETGIAYDHLERGILHLFFSPNEFAHGSAKVPQLEKLGIRAKVCATDECLAIEPALAHLRDQLAGALYAPDDESGDAFRFTQALAARAAELGVRFHYETTITHIAHRHSAIDGIDVRDRDGRTGMLQADQYVVCLGSYGRKLVAPLGEHLPIYPVKGYSVTVPVLDPSLTPSVSLTDESRRIVCSRLGNRLRIAGTAELNGFDTRINAARCQAILDWLESRFPGATDVAAAQRWTGLRPATPSNVPLIGRGGLSKLWYNTGHGTLGWTLACGSASALTALMSGGTSAVPEFPFLPARR